MSYGAGFGNSMRDKTRRGEKITSKKRPWVDGGNNGAAGGPKRPKPKKGGK